MAIYFTTLAFKQVLIYASNGPFGVESTPSILLCKLLYQDARRLPPSNIITKTDHASERGIHTRSTRPLGYIVCQNLVTVADLPVPVSPPLLCSCVLGARRKDSLRHVGSRLDLHRGPRALTRDKGVCESQTRGGITRRLNGCTHGGMAFATHLLESPVFAYSPCQLARCPVSDSSILVAVQLVCCAV